MANRSMQCIRPGLWLGNREAACNLKELNRHGINHLVTVVRGLVLPIKVTAYMKSHLIIPLDDSVDENLLVHLDACLDFLLLSGAVLVHCMAGVSRSAAVIMAFLMHTERLSVPNALEAVRQHRPIALPNCNFLEQLRIYEAMGAPRYLDVQHRFYRCFLLTKVVDRVKSDFNLVVDLPMASDPHMEKVVSDESIYRCRSCRRLLFRGSSILRHAVPCDILPSLNNPPEPVVAGLQSNTEAQYCERELFLEPVEWMRDSLLQMQAKLFCPKCNAKLGACSWLGVRCGCGSWVCPSVHVHHSKVDRVSHSRDKSLINIALPITNFCSSSDTVISDSIVMASTENISCSSES